jgi:peptide/nickel transport system substrate-binding protein
MKKLYVISICAILLILAMPLISASETKPSGKVVFAQRGQNFASAIGGDHSYIKWLQPWVPALHEPLLIKDLKAKITPGLAESWEISDGGLTIKMKLRKGPTFHNGDPITTQDVKFSIERYANEKFKMVFFKELQMKLKSMEIVDDQTIIFRFNEAYNQFWDRFFEYYAILPKNYIEKVGDDEYAKNIVSSGPFKWVGYKQDVYIDVEAYEGHYRHVPEIKNLRFIYVVEDQTRLAMLKVGEADMMVPGPAHLNLLRKDPKYRLVEAENTRTIGLAFADLIREGNWPLKDRRVRMAVSYAIDRKAICDIALQGAASPSNSFLAPWHAGWDEKRATPTPYDPEKAKALLKEAGYPNGFSTQISIQPTMKVDMQAVSGYLAKVGIEAKLNILESGAWTELCFSKKAEGMFWRDAWWNARSHPTSPIDVQLTLKAPWSCGITTQRVSDAIEALGQIPIGHPDLAAKAAEMDDIITEDLPRISLYAGKNIVALGPRIEYYEIIDGFLIPTRTEFIRLKK